MNSKNICPYVTLVIFLFASCLWPSCKTPRQIILQPIREQGPEYLFTQLKKNELKFKTLSLKFDVDATINNENKSFSGNLFIMHDSLVWLSISKFGIEAARILITEDTAKMMNRLNRTYFLGNFDYVSSMFKVDFDFDILQALIIGNDFSYYADDVFKATVDNKVYKLSTIGRHKLKKYIKKSNEEQRVLIQDIWLDPQTFKIIKIQMKEVKQENRKFESTYSDFQTVNEQLFPSVLTYEITDDKRIQLKITFTKISIDRDESMPFRIPASYTRIQR